jgi:hypothetical protein
VDLRLKHGLTVAYKLTKPVSTVDPVGPSCLWLFALGALSLIRLTQKLGQNGGFYALCRPPDSRPRFGPRFGRESGPGPDSRFAGAGNRGPAPVPDLGLVRDSGPDSPGPGRWSTLSKPWWCRRGWSWLPHPTPPSGCSPKLDDAADFEVSDDDSKEGSDISESVSTRSARGARGSHFKNRGTSAQETSNKTPSDREAGLRQLLLKFQR